MSCIFCMIANHEINSSTIYEDDNVIAILDLSQANKGHTLILPKKHYDNLLEVDDNTYISLALAIKKISLAIKKTYHPDGINILTNCGKAAGQTVMHAHIHIIPRYERDQIKMDFSNNEGKYNLEEIKNEIIKNL